MNHSTCAERRPWRARPRPARTLAAVIAAVMAALLAAACSGSPSSTGSGGAPNARGSVNSSSLVGYSHCMRSHGVPNYPDPGGGNTLPDGLPKVGPQQLGVSPSQLQGAQQACQHLLPTGGSLQQQESQCMQNNDCSPALEEQMLTADRKLARCMRSHGVPNFPDPTNGGASGPVFNITKAGISDAASHTGQFIAKLNECGRLVGSNAPESFE